jgi:hypothetical protein
MPDQSLELEKFDRERWSAEISLREREVAVKEREQQTREDALDHQRDESRRSGWRNPLVLALIAAAVAALGNAVVVLINGTLQRQLEDRKAEQLRILEMIKTADPDAAARNLEFLLKAGLVQDSELANRISAFLKQRVPGTGPSLPNSNRSGSPSTPDPNERVLDYKARILSLRGDIEAKGRTTGMNFRLQALQLADLMGKIDEDQLRPAIKIIKHEYRGWAFLMGVSTFAETPPEYISAASRIDHATKAVAEFDLALDGMTDITRDYNAGVPAAIPIYEWMTGPSEDLNRTHYLKAIALAIIARAGGGTSQAAIAELSAIEPTYLVAFPATSNPDLAWALSQSASNRR